MPGNRPQDAIESTYTQTGMGGNRNSMGGGVDGLLDDMAADLVNHLILPIPAKHFNQFDADQISGQFHAQANTSSRTRCRRTRDGFEPSKKKALVAS
jgi:hypothetical protein